MYIYESVFHKEGIIKVALKNYDKIIGTLVYIKSRLILGSWAVPS